MRCSGWRPDHRHVARFGGTGILAFLRNVDGRPSTRRRRSSLSKPRLRGIREVDAANYPVKGRGS